MQSLYKLSPVHAHHCALHAQLDNTAGWLSPARYDAPDDEVRRVREGIGVIDRSPVGKLDIKGNDLRSWGASSLCVIPAKAGIHAASEGLDARVGAQGEGVTESPGRASRVRLVDGVSADGMCCWLRDDWAFVITPPGQAEATIYALSQHEDRCVHLTDMTSAFAALQLAGPHSRTALEKLTALDLRPSRFPDLACAQGRVAKVHALVLREDLAGLPAYWLFISREYGEFVWEAVLHAGEEYGILPFGYEAYGQLKKA